MNLYDYMNASQEDFDTYDNDYDECVTVCFIESETDNYEKFCNKIVKKVEVVKRSGDCLIVNWSKLIRDNIKKFRKFTEKHWHKNCQYRNDEDEFICQWINEINMYMAGYVSENFYKILVDFVDSLDYKEE